MDRGRLLAGMDAELVGGGECGSAECGEDELVRGGVGAATAMGTNVFWGDVVFGAAVVNGERLERVATVEVFATRKRVSYER